MASLRTGLLTSLLGYLGGLRFPVLFLIACALFGFDLLFPDTLPLVDELLLGVSALLLGKLRRKRDDKKLGSGAP